MLTKEFWIKEITMRPSSFISVKKQTPEICKLAVEKSWRNLQHVKKQTDELCLIALNSDPMAIIFIKKQTEEMCWLAVNSRPGTIRFIKNIKFLKKYKNELILICTGDETGIEIINRANKKRWGKENNERTGVD